MFTQWKWENKELLTKMYEQKKQQDTYRTLAHISHTYNILGTPSIHIKITTKTIVQFKFSTYKNSQRARWAPTTTKSRRNI